MPVAAAPAKPVPSFTGYSAVRKPRSSISKIPTKPTDDGINIFGWARNAFDENYFEQLAVGPGNTGLIAGQPGDPRTYGLTLRPRSDAAPTRARAAAWMNACLKLSRTRCTSKFHAELPCNQPAGSRAGPFGGNLPDGRLRNSRPAHALRCLDEEVRVCGAMKRWLF